MKVLIISPSGKLYGSERVLLDFIRSTSLDFDIALPARSDLRQILEKAGGRFSIKEFNPVRLPAFYATLAWWLLLGRYKRVYLNEGAHVRYILFLARIFPAVGFSVHVRILEDTEAGRWGSAARKLPSNLRVITISSYLSGRVPFKSYMLSDPFQFREKNGQKPAGAVSGVFQVGIIGRIAKSKGIDLLPIVLRELESRKERAEFKFHLFGEMGSEVGNATRDLLASHPSLQLHGYVKNNSDIYSPLNAVLHLNAAEPLGRIFFEAIDHLLPFAGINAGGIGESASRFDCLDFVVNVGSQEEMAARLADKLIDIKLHPSKYLELVSATAMRMREALSVDNYSRSLEQIIATG